MCKALQPIKGGNLVYLSDDAKTMLVELHGGSPVSYALRFSAGFSSMSGLEQMRDNISFMKDFTSLNEKKLSAVNYVRGIFKSKSLFCFCALPEARLLPAFFL